MYRLKQWISYWYNIESINSFMKAPPLLFYSFKICMQSYFSWLRPSNAIWWQWSVWSLVEVKACHLFICQAITWTRARLLSHGPSGTIFGEIWMNLIFIHKDKFQNVVCEAYAILLRPCYVSDGYNPTMDGTYEFPVYLAKVYIGDDYCKWSPKL